MSIISANDESIETRKSTTEKLKTNATGISISKFVGGSNLTSYRLKSSAMEQIQHIHTKGISSPLIKSHKGKLVERQIKNTVRTYFDQLDLMFTSIMSSSSIPRASGVVVGLILSPSKEKTNLCKSSLLLSAYNLKSRSNLSS